MAAHLVAVLLLFAVIVGLSSSLSTGAQDGPSPVTRVVKLLQEMKEQVEAESKEDQEIYDKMACWCETNDREKTASIETAKKRIEELAAAIDEGTARAAQLETQIAKLKDDIQADQDSVEKAAAMREKEKSEFQDEAKDMMDALAALTEAIAVLKKVQLMQNQDHGVRPSLVQLHSLVQRVTKAVSILPVSIGQAAVYKSVMQKDLWDMLGSMPGQQRVVTGLSQSQQPTGAAAGATSYSARSSTIFGILEQMKATFGKNLAASQKEEIDAEISFQRLRGAKVAEMESAGKAVEEKTGELADTNNKVAQAKVDIEDTRAALSADQKFLMDLKKRCAEAEGEYNARQKTRREEAVAIGEAIQILAQDEARDLFSKTMSLVQIGSHRQQAAGASTFAERETRARAASQLLAIARRQHGTAGLALARLAVGVQLDGFEKVKELMDKMVVELKKQQGDEYQKHEACKTDIYANEDSTMVKQREEKDLNAQVVSLEAALEQLSKDLEDLQAEVAQTHVALKEAGEHRKAENHEFQQAVADQRATVQILNKALQRLRSFYAPKTGASFLAKGARRQEPGAPVAPPPPAGQAYSKSGGAGGVIQILEKIIQDAQLADQEAVKAEQASQEAYAEFVANTNSMLDSASQTMNEKTIAKEKATADKLIAQKDLQATVTALKDLSDQNHALHLGCDYLLKNYDIRQQARQEEIEAIQEAKAILSGANFGDA